jgi:hypothetical protein
MPSIHLGKSVKSSGPIIVVSAEALLRCIDNCSSDAEKCWRHVKEFSSFSRDANAKSASYGPDWRWLKSTSFWSNGCAASSKLKNSSISSIVVIQRALGRERSTSPRREEQTGLKRQALLYWDSI